MASYEWPGREQQLPAVLIDAELAFIVELWRRGTRNPKRGPRALQLRRAELDKGAQHAAHFGCRLRLGAARDAVVFERDELAVRFVTHNREMLEVLLPYLELSVPVDATPAVLRVRSAIAEHLSGRRPTLQAVSKQLAMSSRAVQRVLTENGTSFRQLRDEVRNQYAQAYLRGTAFTDGEVAFLLGFSDANSFYRAFRSWNGKAPGEFRRRVRRL